MLMLRTPFRIDSVASPAALDAGLRAGDEVVALNGERHIEFSREYCRAAGPTNTSRPTCAYRQRGD